MGTSDSHYVKWIKTDTIDSIFAKYNNRQSKYRMIEVIIMFFMVGYWIGGVYMWEVSWSILILYFIMWRSSVHLDKHSLSHTLKIRALMYVILLFLKSGRTEPQTPKILLNITKTLLLLLLHQVKNYQQGCPFFFHVINMHCGIKKSIFLHSNNVI